MLRFDVGIERFLNHTGVSASESLLYTIYSDSNVGSFHWDTVFLEMKLTKFAGLFLNPFKSSLSLIADSALAFSLLNSFSI